MPVIYEPKGRAKEYSLLAANLFTGCSHNCDYCYARKMAGQYGIDFDNPKPKDNVLKQLEKDARKYKGTDKRVLLCFICDPYPPEEIEQGITREALKILRQFDIPFQVLTKGGMRAARDFDLYGPNDCFACTLTFTNQTDSLEHEPGAALPSDRIESLRQAHKAGIETWASLEPVIDAQQSLEIIRQTHKFTSLFKIGKLNHQASSTNWRAFGTMALNLCWEYGKRYFIKKDLAGYLQGIEFTNTDSRTIPIKTERQVSYYGKCSEEEN